MADLELKRHFDAPPERVFEFVTQAKHVTQWWGPEGITLGDSQLDLSQLGPWSSIMLGEEDVRYKVTGEVTAIEVGKRVTFTWAWHEDDDSRGNESIVRFSVSSDGNGGTDFTMLHSGLPNDDSANNHEGGWTSSFVKLERYARQVEA